MKNKVKERIRKTIFEHKLIENGDVVILGLSGGPDSVCLFHVLLELRQELGFELFAAHVNHMFRPGAALDDQRFVEELCHRENVSVYTCQVDCNKLAKDLKITSEEAGRKARYDFFRDIEKSLVQNGVSCEKVKIATGHNRDDQAETVLFRIIRGTGTDGLSGIDYTNINHNGSKLIRPLLDVPREHIEEFCAERGLEPRIDETNLQMIYGRNKIRLDVIPYLMENYNPNIKEALVSMADISRQDKSFIWKMANEAYEKAIVKIVNGETFDDGTALDEGDFGASCKKNINGEPLCKNELCVNGEPLCSRKALGNSEVLLNREVLMGLDPAVRNRVIFKAFSNIGLDSDISHIHMTQAEKLILKGVTPQEISFPKGYVLRISYENVSFGREVGLLGKRYESKESHFSEPRDRKFEPKLKVSALDMAEYTQLKDCLPRNKWSAFDFDSLKEQLGNRDILSLVKIRKREPGDFIRLSSNRGRKKVQDLFVDMKVAKYTRDEIFLVAIGHEVLWIPRASQLYQFKGRYSGNFKVTEDTKKVLLVEIDSALC